MSDERERAVRERACAIWEQEGQPEGRTLAHWLQAEAEIGCDGIAGITDNGKPASLLPPGPVVSRRRRAR